MTQQIMYASTLAEPDRSLDESHSNLNVPASNDMISVSQNIDMSSSHVTQSWFIAFDLMLIKYFNFFY